MHADHTYNLSLCLEAKSIVLKSCTYDNNINHAICCRSLCGYIQFFSKITILLILFII